MTTIVNRVVDELERLALDELRPGQQLPAEGEIATTLGVSRLSVREAVRELQARGILVSRKGRRPVVRAPDGEQVEDFFRTAVRRDPGALFELIEVRRALEVHNATLAATRASRAAVRATQLALAEMEAATAPEDAEAFHEADERFHEALAAATGNSMLVFLVEGLAEPLRVSRRHSWGGRGLESPPVEAVIAQHRDILDRVMARDADGAAAAMRAHLDSTERDLRANLSDRSAERQ